MVTNLLARQELNYGKFTISAIAAGLWSLIHKSEEGGRQKHLLPHSFVSCIDGFIHCKLQYLILPREEIAKTEMSSNGQCENKCEADTQGHNNYGVHYISPWLHVNTGRLVW
jgi:hypothetical protein